MKKIISILLVILFGSTIAVESAIAAAAEGFPGESGVKECIEKADKLLKANPGVAGEISGISNPLDSKRTLTCKGKTLQDYIFQAVVDVLFTDIDLKVEKYLKTLNGTKEPMKAVDDLQKKFGVSGEKGSFYRMYNDVCKVSGTAFKRSAELAGGADMTNPAFKEKCFALFSMKLQAYYDAGEVIVARETELTYQKDKKKFMTKVKDKYRDLLFKLTIYLGQLKVINAKWYTNTKKPS